MFNHNLRACLLAFGLLAMAFGSLAQAQTSSGAQAQMQGAKRMATDATDQFKAAGATMVPRMPMPKLLASAKGGVFVCDKTSCACRGPSECVEMFKACAPKTTTCTQPASLDPYCRCDK